MATRRRIGVSVASTEAARRQLMQPVSCWERTWTSPENIPNISFKVRKWTRTDKLQQFSDDEGGADEPLAPLPDEPEVVDGDEEMEQDEQVANGMESAPPGTRAATAPQEETQPMSPKPQLLLEPSTTDGGIDNTMDGLDASPRLCFPRQRQWCRCLTDSQARETSLCPIRNQAVRRVSGTVRADILASLAYWRNPKAFSPSSAFGNG